MSVQQILIGMVHSEELAAKERDVKDQLQQLIRQMYQSGILYSEAIREFKKRFILDVLRENRGNQCKAARELGMHRNTLSRTIVELGMQGDVNDLLRQCGGRAYSARVKLERGLCAGAYGENASAKKATEWPSHYSRQ